MIVGHKISVLRQDDSRAGGVAARGKRGDGHHTWNHLFIDVRQFHLPSAAGGDRHPKFSGKGLRRGSERGSFFRGGRIRREDSRSHLLRVQIVLPHGLLRGRAPPVHGNVGRRAEQEKPQHSRQPSVAPPSFRRTVASARAVIIPIWRFASLFAARIQIHGTSLRCFAPSTVFCVQYNRKTSPLH